MRNRASILLTASDATKAAFDSIEANVTRMTAGVRRGAAEFSRIGVAARDGATEATQALANTRQRIDAAVAGFSAAKRGMERLAAASTAATAAVAQAARELAQDPGSKELQQRFEALRNQARATKAEFAAARAETDTWRRSLTGLGVNTRDLSSSLRTARAAGAAPAAGIPLPASERLAPARGLLEVSPWRAIEREVQQVEAAYGRLRRSGTLTAGELGQAFANLQGRIVEIRAQTNGLAAHFETVRGALASLVASAAGLTAAVRETIAFESAMNGVRRVANLSAEETAALAGEVRRLAMETGESAVEIAGMVKAAASAGIARDQLLLFTEQAIKAGVAFDMLPAEAGESLAKLAGIFKIPLTEIDAFSGAVNLLADNAKTSEKAVVETLVRGAGSAGQSFGLLREQTAALATAILDMGLAPEIAGTAMRTLLDGLRHAIVDSGEAAAGLRSLGLDAAQFGGRLATDASGALDEFLARLSALDSLSRRRALERLFGSGLDTSVIEQLAGNLDQLRTLMGMAGQDAGTFRQALADVFAIKMGETKTGLARLWESIKALGDALGTLLLPAVRAVTIGLQAMAQGLRQFVQTFPALATLATILIPVVASLSVLRLAFGALVALAGRFASSLSSAFIALLAPIGALAGWVARLLAGFSVLGAFLAGWDIGTLLAARFESVRRAGVLMAAGIALAFEEVRYRWEQFLALFSDDTLDAAAARHQQRLDDMGDHFREAYAQAADGAAKAGQRETASGKQATDALTAQRKELADKRAQLAQLTVDREKAIAEAGAKNEKEILAKRIEDARAAHGVTKSLLDEAIADLTRYRDAARRAFEEAASTRAATADKVRALRRRDMDEAAQQRDIELEAQQKLRAARVQAALSAKAAGSGDTEGAERAASAAKRLAEQASGLGESLKQTGAAIRIVQAAGAISARASESIGKANSGAAKGAEDRIATLGQSLADLESRLIGMEQKQITLQIDTNIEAVTQQIAALEARLAGLARTTPGASVPTPAAGATPPKFQTGGWLPGYGGGDRIHALLEAGEFIVRKEAVRRYGLSLLNALNHGQLPRFAQGGPVTAGGAISLNLPAAAGAGERVDLYLHFPDGAAPARVTTPRDEARALIARMGTLRFYGAGT